MRSMRRTTEGSAAAAAVAAGEEVVVVIFLGFAPELWRREVRCGGRRGPWGTRGGGVLGHRWPRQRRRPDDDRVPWGWSRGPWPRPGSPRRRGGRGRPRRSQVRLMREEEEESAAAATVSWRARARRAAPRWCEAAARRPPRSAAPAEVTTVVVVEEYGCCWAIISLSVCLGCGLGLEIWVGLTFYGGIWAGLSS